MVDHNPKFISPWYADANDGTLIHRYLTDEFVDNFLREAAQGSLQSNQHQVWQKDDKFGGDTVKLRLPIHRTFYMTATELVCDTLGKPAFSPNKIVSAGFVIRKKVDQSFQIWRVKNGVSLGWQSPDVTQLDKDPDIRKQLKTKNLLDAQSNTRAYSGEQTYPLHAHVVSATESGGRNHTLLYGYVSLNGTATSLEVTQSITNASTNQSSSNSSIANNQNQRVNAAGYLAEFEWPFGSWDGTSSEPVCTCSGTLEEIIQKMCDQFQWSSDIELQVNNRQASRAFANWLGILVNRYQINDSSVDANKTLIDLLKSIPIFSQALTTSQQDALRAAQGTTAFSTISINDASVGSRASLYDYISANAEALSNWYSDQVNKFSQAGSAIPDNWTGLGSPLKYGLKTELPYIYIFQSQSEQIRAAMLLRAEAANQTVEATLPLPRYTQGKNDLYFICPFVRYLDDCGCEKVLWGKESFNFRVASPLDPQANRPSVIQLPELSDIKKGFANGVTFLTPKSLSDKLLNIAPSMDMKQKLMGSPIDACLGFSISFSIPIITLCAMILLMIILNLLNLIFFWLPYAMLILPRGCGPEVPPKNG